MKCEKCHGSGFYGDNGPGRKGNREYTRCDCQEDMPCTTHHACNCIRERLDRIEAVWQKYQHMDEVLCDDGLVGEGVRELMLFDLWQAIRREE